MGFSMLSVGGLGERSVAGLSERSVGGRRAPLVPISVEVHNDLARSQHSPAELARIVAEHTRLRFGHYLR